jgi:hypothetical protein
MHQKYWRYMPTHLARWGATGTLLLLLLAGGTRQVSAITALPTPQPKGGSYGLEATKKQPAPTDAPSITTPGNGGSFSTSPITISGLCKTDLLIEVYDNGAFVGSINCQGGSYSLQITLFTGQNDLTVIQYDDLDQASPVSNLVTVTYNNASFSSFGTLITLTSNYGRRAADPGSTLTWPLILSGGTGPYAFSTDWGDGSGNDLKSVAASGNVDITHVYKQAGLYHVTIKVTDVNGVTAFLQVIAIANGKGSSTSASSGGGPTKTVTVTKVLWIPAIIAFALLFPTYWLGRKSELVILHKQLEKNMENYKDL